MSKFKQRRAARMYAFQALYGIGFAKVSTELALRSAFVKTPFAVDDDKSDEGAGCALDVENIDKPGLPTQEIVQDMAWGLVHGVWAHSNVLDEIISRFSHHWRVDRMGRIEVTLLRLSIYEMLYREDIPLKVAINEALELAKHFGEDSARSFVNGILDAVAKAVERGELTR